MSVVRRQLKLNNIIIESRASDNFINATQLCKAGGKKVNDFLRLEDTKEYIKVLEEALKEDKRSAGNPADHNSMNKEKIVEIIRTGPNNLRGTWFHQELTIKLASWISKIFEVKVYRWVRELLITGSVSIDSNKTSQELDELQQKVAQLQLEQEKQQLLLKEKEEEIFLKNQLITTQMDDNFWIMATNKNNLTLKKYGKLAELFYLGGIKHKARQDTYNNKAGLSCHCETRDSELSTGSSPNSPFESIKFTLPEGSEYIFESYIHSLLEPFNIKKSRTQKDRKKGAKEHFMIPNTWMLYFIQKARENHIALIEEVNELIDLVEDNNMNYDKINKHITDMFEECEDQELDQQESLQDSSQTDEESEDPDGSYENKDDDEDEKYDETYQDDEESDGIDEMPKQTKEKLRCQICGKNKSISDFSIYIYQCDKCAKNRLKNFKDAVLDTLTDEDEKFELNESDQLKLAYIRNNIKYITNADIMSKKKITEIGDYKRCASKFHKFEIDRWLLKTTSFSVWKDPTKLVSCKECYRKQKR